MNDFETVRNYPQHYHALRALDRIEAEVERLRADEEVWTEENDQLRAELDTMQKALDDMNEKVVASWGIETNLKLEVERLRKRNYNLGAGFEDLKAEVKRLRAALEQLVPSLERHGTSEQLAMARDALAEEKE